MSLSWLMAAFLILLAVLFIITLILIIHYMKKTKTDKHIQLHEAPKNSVDVTVYAYDPDVGGLEDIRAKRIGIYRDTGLITGMEDDCLVYQESLIQTKDNDHELGLIVRSATEVKRVSDKTIIYFFTRIKPLKISSNKIRTLYDCISQGLDNNRPMVLRMTKSADGNVK